MEEESPEKRFQEEFRKKQEEAQALYEKRAAELAEEQKTGVEKTMEEIEQIREDYKSNLESKTIRQRTEVTLYQEGALYDPNKS